MPHTTLVSGPRGRSLLALTALLAWSVFACDSGGGGAGSGAGTGEPAAREEHGEHTGAAEHAGHGAESQPTSAPQSDGEYVEAMAREHQHDSAAPSPMVAAGAGEGSGVAAPALRGETVTFGGSEEAPLRGYLVAPPTGAESAPGVVLIHEWWGLNDNIRAMADRLADAGYRALAVDMYGGQAAETPEGARALMEAAMADPSAGVAILERAVAFLREGGAPQVGTIGWCFGGGWSLRAGLTQGEAVDAVVVYYGHVPTEASELASLQAPLIGFFGAEDGGIPVADVRAFEAALQANEARAEIHVYEGAGHAFANPSGANYQAAPAQDSWARTLAFFAEHLGGSAAEAPPQ